jgi:hypothetical protein
VFQTRATATGRATLGVALPTEDGAESKQAIFRTLLRQAVARKGEKNHHENS